MLAAAPMDREDDLARALVDVGDDVCDEGAQKLLAGAHRYAGRVPGRFEIVGQAREIRRLDGRCRRQPVKPCFAGLDPLERGFPALLKLGGNQTMVGIARRIAAFGQRSLVACLLQLEIRDALSFVSAFIPLRPASPRGPTAIGSTTRRTSRAIAASIREPPNPRHRGRPSIWL